MQQPRDTGRTQEEEEEEEDTVRDAAPSPGQIPDDAAAATGASVQKLNLQKVLAVALQIIDTEGLDALSMRRLGHALNREPSSLYHYAANKAALLDGVVQVVLAELTIDPDSADWRDALRNLGADFRGLAQAHPNVVPLLAVRPLATPLGLRPAGTLQPLENFLALLVRVGFTPTEALYAYRLFFGFLLGHILSELQEIGSHPEETELLLKLNFQRMPRAQFSHLRNVADELANYDGAHQLRQGIELIITGLQLLFI